MTQKHIQVRVRQQRVSRFDRPNERQILERKILNNLRCAALDIENVEVHLILGYLCLDNCSKLVGGAGVAGNYDQVENRQCLATEQARGWGLRDLKAGKGQEKMSGWVRA